jgi:hypothetical protein
MQDQFRKWFGRLMQALGNLYFMSKEFAAAYLNIRFESDIAFAWVKMCGGEGGNFVESTCHSRSNRAELLEARAFIVFGCDGIVKPMVTIPVFIVHQPIILHHAKPDSNGKVVVNISTS